MFAHTINNYFGIGNTLKYFVKAKLIDEALRLTKMFL